MSENQFSFSNCSFRQLPLTHCLDQLILELMQINMSLCIIYNLVNVVYEKTVYEGKLFISENL